LLWWMTVNGATNGSPNIWRRRAKDFAIWLVYLIFDITIAMNWCCSTRYCSQENLPLHQKDTNSMGSPDGSTATSMRKGRRFHQSQHRRKQRVNESVSQLSRETRRLCAYVDWVQYVSTGTSWLDGCDWEQLKLSFKNFGRMSRISRTTNNGFFLPKTAVGSN
jgi:hypothetical protein